MSENCPSFIPRDIFDNLVESPPNFKLKILAIQELHQYVQSLDSITLQSPSRLSFLFPYLSSSNFKISVTAFVILRDILGKLEDSSIEDELRDTIIPMLIDKWNDSKLVIRHATSSVMAKIASRVLGSHELISILISYLPEEPWNIKEEMINFVIYCLLKHGHSAYDYAYIIGALTKTLKDPKLRVKFVSVEALAVIHSNIGSRIMPYLEQFKQNDTKTFKLLQERFKQPTLPMLSRSTKGVVEHKLLLRLHRQSPQARGRRVQSAYIHQKEGLNSPNAAFQGGQTTHHNHVYETNNNSSSSGYASRYPTKPASNNRNNANPPLQASMRAHSAPRRLQSDEEYVTYNPNSPQYLNNKEDSEDDDAVGSDESQEEGFVPLHKPIAVLKSSNSHRVYRYRNSVIDDDYSEEQDRYTHSSTDENQQKKGRVTSQNNRYQLNSSHSQDEMSSSGESSRGSDNSSKVTLWLSNTGSSSEKKHSPLRKRPVRDSWAANPSDVVSPQRTSRSSSISSERSDHSSRVSSRASHRTPRSKRMLNLNIVEESANNDNGTTENNNVQGQPGSRQRSISLSVTPPASTRLLDPSNFSSARDTVAAPQAPAPTSPTRSPTNSPKPAITRNRKRPRPIRVTPTHLQVTGAGSSSATPSSDDASPNRLSANSQNSSTLSSPSKTVDFVERDDLQICSNPSSVMKRSINNLTSDDWETRFHAVTDARRLAVHHPEVISSHLQEFVSPVSKFMLDLRSLLSKNAIVCMQELFESQGRKMDSDLPRIIPLLLKKTGEANRFINQQADATLKAMVHHANTEKCLIILLAFGTHKNSTIRLSAAQIVSEAAIQLDTKLFRFKDLKKLFTVVMGFIQDSSAGVRTWGRKIALTIFQVYSGAAKRHPFDRFIGKYLSSHEMNAFMDAVEKAEKGIGSTRNTSTYTAEKRPRRRSKVKRFGVSTPGSTASPVSSPHPSSANTPTAADALSISSTPLASPGPSSASTLDTTQKRERRKKVRTMRPKKPPVVKKLMDDKTTEEFKNLYTLLDSSDWRDRLKGLSEVTDKIRNNVEMFGEYETTRVMDYFTPRLVDANVKNTCTSLGANNNKVNRAASDAFDVLASHVDKIALISHLPQLVVSSNTKIRGLLIQKYSTFVEEAYNQKPEAVVRYVVPIAFKLAKNAKSVVKNNNMQMMRVLHGCMGKDLWIHAHSLDVDVLERLERNLYQDS